MSATGNQGEREVGKSSQVGREVGSLSLPINVIEEVEVVSSCEDDDFPLIRSIVVEEHVSLSEGLAVF